MKERVKNYREQNIEFVQSNEKSKDWQQNQKRIFLKNENFFSRCVKKNQYWIFQMKTRSICSWKWNSNDDGRLKEFQDTITSSDVNYHHLKAYTTKDTRPTQTPIGILRGNSGKCGDSESAGARPNWLQQEVPAWRLKNLDMQSCWDYTHRRVVSVQSEAIDYLVIWALIKPKYKSSNITN